MKFPVILFVNDAVSAFSKPDTLEIFGEKIVDENLLNGGLIVDSKGQGFHIEGVRKLGTANNCHHF